MGHSLDGKRYVLLAINYYVFMIYSSTNGLGYNSSVMDRFIAPATFTGDFTGSYSLELVVHLQLPQNASVNVNMSAVEICGPGGIECLVGSFGTKLQSDRIIQLSVSNVPDTNINNIISVFIL